MCGKRSLGLALFSLSLLLASVPATGQEATPSPTFSLKVNSLRVISQKAVLLAQALSLKLTASQESVTKLSTMLEATQGELTRWQSDLEAQRQKAELSATEFAELSATAKALQLSLDKSTADFETYKTTSEATIRRLEGEKVQWFCGGMVAGALALTVTHNVLKFLGVIK